MQQLLVPRHSATGGSCRWMSTCLVLGDVGQGLPRYFYLYPRATLTAPYRPFPILSKSATPTFQS